MTSVCILSANLGGYDQPQEWAEQVAPPGTTIEVHRFTDETFPPRRLAMTSRLQCGLLKMFGPEFVPGRDIYLWVDASCALLNPYAAAWFLAQLGAADIAVFRHPDRQTVREEYEFMKARMARPGETYLTSRYRGEWLGEQFAAVERLGYGDAQLFASTAFIYRNHPPMRAALKEWWAAKSRYCLHDQLAFPAVLGASRCRVHVIQESYLQCQGLTYVRNRRRRSVA